MCEAKYVKENDCIFQTIVSDTHYNFFASARIVQEFVVS